MDNALTRSLVIISVPFYRIARVSLSDRVLNVLQEHSDIAIVAPFAGEPGFQRSFQRPNTMFLGWTFTRPNGLGRLLLTASEIMRVNGYWRRFSAHGLEYYVANQYRVFGEDGRDEEFGIRRRAVYWLLGTAGQRPAAWALIDRLLGAGWCRCPRLADLARPYANVTLVQSANWGLQDRALATISREAGWRTVLLPYTTDQLDTNGYLLNHFDAVCVQGPYEADRAWRFHAIPPARLHRLGSAWFRHLEDIKAEAATERPAENAGFVLYAGVSPVYFPRENEFAAVDAIAEYLARSGTPLKLIYRPVEQDESKKPRIQERYGRSATVRLQWPSISELGLEQYSSLDQRQALRNYVDGLAGCRLLIMSGTTTLALDAAFLERCGVVAYSVDDMDVMKKRKTHLLSTNFYPGLRLATSIPELLDHVDVALKHPAEAARASAALVEQWDYPDAKFRDLLIEGVRLARTSGREVMRDQRRLVAGRARRAVWLPSRRPEERQLQKCNWTGSPVSEDLPPRGLMNLLRNSGIMSGHVTRGVEALMRAIHGR